MASTFYEPFHGFGRFFEEAFSGRHESDDNQGRRSIGRGEGDNAVRPFKPQMDLHEDAEKNLVTASFEFPGLSKDDVQISVHNGRLMVAAHTKSSTDMNDHEKGYAVRERRFGRFWRTLQLPLGVKEDQINASMKDGVLNITFPKATLERAPSRISVS